VTATGGGVVGANQASQATFAGVFEKDSTPFLARHGIDWATFKDACSWAKQHQHVLRWATIYGGKKRRYAGVWEKAPAGVSWDYTLTVAIDGPELAVPVEIPGTPPCAWRSPRARRSPSTWPCTAATRPVICRGATG
jgi:hypothetical protein